MLLYVVIHCLFNFAKIHIKKKLAKFIFILIMKMMMVMSWIMMVLEMVIVNFMVVMEKEMINKGEMVGLALDVFGVFSLVAGFLLTITVRRGRRR